MKARGKKLFVSLSALLLAGTVCASVACAEPAALNKTQTSAEGTRSIVDVTDTLGKQLDTRSLLDPDALAAGQAKTKSDGTRRIIVEMNSASTLDAYLGSAGIQKSYADFTEYVNATEGRRYAATLEREQNVFLSALSRTALDYEVRHTYTSVLNGVSLVVNDEDVAAIGALPGVKDIIYSESYAIPAVEATINEVDVYGTGIYDSSDIDYKGDGILVAVLDTGFDRNHRAFQIMPEEQKLTYAQVSQKMGELAASAMSPITVDDVYYNAKVPFAYDYADDDPDVFPKSSSHGLHVAGIIAGQDATADASDGEAFETQQGFIGVAPNAQLMIAKVFPDTEDGIQLGAETDDLLAALSDCVTLGVDIINMSLGVSAGFSREADGDKVNAVYDKINEAGINLVCAASNDGSSAQNGAYGSTNLTSNPDSGTVGSPSTYPSALSVASISGQKSSYMELGDGTAVYFNESSNAAGDQGDFVAELLNGEHEKTFNFVVVPGYGYTYNYNASVRAQLAQGNCIAVVSRGDNSFEDKQKIAFEYGAVACIIYNNMSGMISASLGTGKEIPTCTVSADIGRSFVSQGSGTIYLNEDYKAGPFMSSFSSWGPTPDLKIKPEITAHGGEITSSVVGGYNIYSGTSMASPNMAGAVALLRQHVEETTDLTGRALADRVNQLLMSTATIVNDERGLPYAVRKQGAGLGDIGKAISSDGYLWVENDTKPKLELGDDPQKTGEYTMEFHVTNRSARQKTYTLGAIVMTESVSIDGITVAEQSYMLDGARKTYTVNGAPCADGSVTLAAGEDAKIGVTIALTADEKAYLNENFANGMYVEGYITLTDADAEGVDLSIPYLAFYGDWLQAPVFDKTTYEVSHDKYDTSIEDKDKAIAAVYESVMIGRYYRGSDTYLPLGEYVYNLENDEDSGIESSVDKVAIGNSDYGIYEFYAVYFGLLRAIDTLELHIENASTGETVWEETIQTVSKSYGTTPSYAEIELSPYELGLKNNTKYNVVFTAYRSYDGREAAVETEEFSFYVDYETPIVYESAVRYEYDAVDRTLRHAYLDLSLYDNHYVQAVQLFSQFGPEGDETIDWLMQYSQPVDSARGAINHVTIEITDWLDNVFYVEDVGYCLGVRLDDYALNSAAYLVPITYPEVSGMDITYTYYDLEGYEQEASLGDGATLLMQAGTGLDFEEDTGTVRLPSGEEMSGIEFETHFYNYATYACSHIDAYGDVCGFVYDEHAGYTYAEGDYYYDAASGSVLQKRADETQPAYPAGTLFTDMIASYSGSQYVSNHFVCPKCGTEATFTYNSRTDTLTPVNFTKTSADAMAEEVIWSSSDESVVRVENGRLYAVSAGTATICGEAPDAAEYPYPMQSDGAAFTFTVEVTGEAKTPAVEALSVGKYYDVTNNATRIVTGSSATVENGTELVLYPSFRPWYVDELPGLTWSSSDPDTVEILKSDHTYARILCKKPGGASVMLQGGGFISAFTLYIEDEFKLLSTYCYEYNGPGYSETYTDPETQETRKILVIPANLGITNLGYVADTTEGTFYENKNLDTVVVPEGVTALGPECFINSSLRRIYLPSSLIAVSYSAFRGCTQLEGVYWYDASDDSDSGIVYDADENTYNWEVFFAAAGVEMTSQSCVFGSDAFRDCAALDAIDLDGVTGLYDFAFRGCVGLTSADLTDLRFAGTGIFYGCENLTSVTLGSATQLSSYMFAGTGVKNLVLFGDTVPDAAFADMTSLKNVTLNGAVTALGRRAFEGCTQLEAVNFSSSCGAIGDYAFAGCEALTSVALPAGVTALGNYAFEGCANLASVTLDGSIEFGTIGADVFRGCARLAKIVLDGESTCYETVTSGEYSMLTDLDGNALLVPPAYPVGETESVTVGTGMTKIGANAYANNNTLAGKELIIAESVTALGDGAFAGTGIVSVTIPATVTTWGADIFAYCESLTRVTFLGAPAALPEGMFRGCTQLASIDLPANVTTIGESAFEGAGLTSLTLGEQITKVGDYAFADTASLTEVAFKGAGLTAIGDAAFYGAAFGTLVLPDSVASMGAYAFAGNAKLRSVTVSAGLREMGAYAFANCGTLRTVTFRDGAAVVGDYAFVMVEEEQLAPGTWLESVTLPQSITSIGQYAFAGATGLEKIDLSGVETIGDYAFYTALHLTEVTLNGDTTSIGASAFEGSGVTQIDLSGVETFGARSFYGTKIAANTFTDAVTIGKDAFYGCVNIAGRLAFPNAERIADYAFYIPGETESGYGQTGRITAVTFGEGLKELGGGAFFNSRIQTIELPASLETIGETAFAGYLELLEISVADGNETFFVDEAEGGLYKRLPAGYELIAVPNALALPAEAETPFKILEGTCRIGAWAMAYCEEIAAVEIPADVKSIGPGAFYMMGMGPVLDGASVGMLDESLYPTYIFKGLEAPIIESDYSDEEAANITVLYNTFSYDIGALLSKLVVPANATGFDGVIFEFFFASREYSAEVMETLTQELLAWLQALDVDALTLADEAEVMRKDTDYRMLSSGQQAFLAEYRDKLTAAVEKINALKGEVTPPEPSVPDGDPDGPDVGLIVGLSVGGAAVLAAAAAVTVVLVRRSRKEQK